MTVAPIPGEYRPKEPVVAAKFEKPYARVAEWCGGEIIRRYGKGSTVVGMIVYGAYGEKITVNLGDYVARDPVHPDYFTKYDGPIFERTFERQSCQEKSAT
jgi:hypothetical protein